MRAVTVCVDYSDFLSVTLPRNLRHFESIAVVTSSADVPTQRLAQELDCPCFVTDSFYDDGADFNKWKALEEGLDRFGRKGWLCLLDADVIWPSNPVLPELEVNKLYGPYRRLLPDYAGTIPEESGWDSLPQHPNVGEIAGYSQIFHADAPALGPPPWHEINWRHAGCADSFFQQRWKPENRVRLDWDVLHLGESGKNWCGRSPEARRKLAEYKSQRKYHLQRSREAFKGERL